MTTSHPPAITQALQLHREGKRQESRDCLRDFLLQHLSHIDALLWLARVTPDPQEAIAAAELALKLDPGNEIAQRAVIAVRKQAGILPERPAERTELSAAVALSTGMTLAQARAVRWPFRGINRSIGDALDDGTIALRDLGWAVENAQDTRIQDAARTVLLARLAQVELQEPPSPLRIIAGSRFSERQERRSMWFLGLFLGIALTLWAIAAVLNVVLGVLQYGYGQKLPCWFSLLIFGTFLSAFLAVKWSDRYYDRADQYRLGRWGEEKVLDLLRCSLDGHWTLFRNFEWPHRKWGDVDLILVGAGGVWAFEVKAYSGQIRNVGDRWERKNRRRWRKLTTHPGHQARRNAARLKEYLKNNGIDLRWVEPVVIWAGESGTLTFQDPATLVWNLEALSRHIEELWQSRTIPQETVQQIVSTLERAIQ
jgi:Holliday junction resolvase-like predicted endonuclease